MKNMLMEAAARCGMELDERSAAQMAEFWAYLKEVNQSMNLTRVDSDDEAAERHFVDSLAPLKAGLIPRGARVLDVGSGAGFPGMPLAIARPDADVTLMDSLGKRVNFLSDVIAALGLNAQAVHFRAEEAAKNPQWREQFDCVTARAVAAMPTLAELALPFARVGGRLIAYKGPAAGEELRQAERAIELLGGGNARILQVRIPEREDWDHRLVLVDKQRATPRRFPRKSGEAGRNPILSE